jgi:hypothetical protein
MILKILTIILLVLISACSSPARRPAQIFENNLAEINDMRAYVDFIDAGLEKNKRHYFLHLELFTNRDAKEEEDEIKGAEIYINEAPVHWLELKRSENGDLYIKEKIPLKLPEDKTFIRILFKDGYKDFPLICTRLRNCE